MWLLLVLVAILIIREKIQEAKADDYAKKHVKKH